MAKKPDLVKVFDFGGRIPQVHIHPPESGNAVSLEFLCAVVAALESLLAQAIARIEFLEKEVYGDGDRKKQYEDSVNEYLNGERFAEFQRALGEQVSGDVEFFMGKISGEGEK